MQWFSDVSIQHWKESANKHLLANTFTISILWQNMLMMILQLVLLLLNSQKINQSSATLTDVDN